jgi:hypothetical protein
VVGELEELLDPDAPGGPQDLDGRPSPKGVGFLAGQVATFAALEVIYQMPSDSSAPDES